MIFLVTISLLATFSFSMQPFTPSQYIDSTVCPKFSCVDQSLLRYGFCVFNDWPNIEISNNICGSGQECYVNDFYDGVCLNQATTNQQTYLYPGQYCSGVDGVCKFGRQTCQNGICVGYGYGETCKFSADCNYGMYCNKGICLPLAQAGESCLVNDACSRDCLCYQPPGSLTGTCTRLFSLSDGTHVGYYTSSGRLVVPQYWEKLCRAQFVDSNGECNSKGKSANLGGFCNSTLPCASTVSGQTASCQCTYQTGGQEACAPLAQDDVWVTENQEFLTYYYATRNCHPAAGFTECGASSEYAAWRCAYVNAKYYVQLMNNPPCLKQLYPYFTFFSDYSNYCLGGFINFVNPLLLFCAFITYIVH